LLAQALLVLQLVAVLGHAALLLQLACAILRRLVPLALGLVVAIGALALGADALLLLLVAQARLFAAVAGPAHVIATLLPLRRLRARRDLAHLGLGTRDALLHIVLCGLLRSGAALRVLPGVEGRARGALLIAAVAKSLRGLRALHVLPWLGPLARRTLFIVALAGFALGGMLAGSVLTRGILAWGSLVGTPALPLPTTATVGLGLGLVLFRSVVLRIFLAGAVARVVAGAGLGAETQREDRAQR
jgi:hypothetical protein